MSGAYPTVKESLAAVRQNKRPLIAVHRGSGGGIVIPNTIRGAKAALVAGADMVELDVVRSADGVYFTFHDTYEPILLGESRSVEEMMACEIEALSYYAIQGSACGSPERYGDTLAALRGVLINVDRSYRYWKDGFLDELATWGNPDYLLIKSDPTPEYLAQVAQCPTRFPYMAVVRREADIAAAEEAASDGAIDLVGFEVLARDSHDSLLDADYLAHLHEKGYALWFNAINLENGIPLCGGFDDVTSIFADPDLGWGRLVERGASVIQTDWPSLLRDYLIQSKHPS